MVKQSVNATFEDIRKRELLAELELRVIEIQCSAPVMWITPSQRICQGFPMVITHDLRPTATASVTPANRDISRKDQNFHLSLYVWRATTSICHCAHILCSQGDRRLRMKGQTSININE